MKKIIKWIKEHLPRWLDINESKHWEKKSSTWEDTAPSDFEQND